VELAVKYRLPVIYFQKEFVDEVESCPTGQTSVTSFGARLFFVDKILKGTKPADLPVEQPTKFEFCDQSQDGEADRRDDST